MDLGIGQDMVFDDICDKYHGWAVGEMATLIKYGITQ